MARPHPGNSAVADVRLSPFRIMQQVEKWHPAARAYFHRRVAEPRDTARSKEEVMLDAYCETIAQRIAA